MTALILLSEWEKSQIEFWKPIEGFPGYDISSNGRVRSWWKRGFRKGHRGYVTMRSAEPVFLSLIEHRQGYREAYLYSRTQKRRRFFVHRLVALAFIANAESAPEVNHITGVKHDSRTGALEWSSASANQRHSLDNGLKVMPRGLRWLTKKRQKRFTFDPDSVRDVRRRVAGGEMITEIARELAVHPETISRIVHRRRWAHVE